MINFLGDLKYFLEKIDHYRDELLFLFIKPYWPRKISPNQLSYIRITLGTILIVLLFFFKIENKPLIILLFCVGAVTDLFDGSVARGLDEVTELGTMLDPIADRVLILPIAIYSLFGPHKWLLLFFLLAEALGAVISIFHKSKDKDIKPNIFGKTKMVLLSIVFAGILVFWPNPPSIFFIDLIWVSLFFLCLSIFARVLEMRKNGFIKNKVINKQLQHYEDL